MLVVAGVMRFARLQEGAILKEAVALRGGQVAPESNENMSQCTATPNPSLKRTRTGMSFQALISFWAFHGLPARAA